MNRESVAAALREALSTLPFINPRTPQEGRDFLVNRAIVVDQIARALGLADVRAEALQMLRICEIHEQREAKGCRASSKAAVVFSGVGEGGGLW